MLAAPDEVAGQQCCSPSPAAGYASVDSSPGPPSLTRPRMPASARLASGSPEGIRQVAKTKDVRAAVDKELRFDPRGDSAHIAISNISGDVTLTGTVPSYPQYLEAAAAARRVAGVTGVHNHLEVVLP